MSRHYRRWCLGALGLFLAAGILAALCLVEGVLEPVVVVYVPPEVGEERSPDQSWIPDDLPYHPSEDPLVLPERGADRYEIEARRIGWNAWRPSGTVRALRDDGDGEPHLLAEIGYRGDRRHGPARLYGYRGSDPFREGRYRDGRRIGDWIAWYDEDRPAEFARYRDGRPHGEWISWHPNGRIFERGTYVDGEKHGTWEM